MTDQNDYNRKGFFIMRYFVVVFLLLSVSTAALGATGASVTYQVNGQSYEGYFISPSDQAPFVLLIHDWDGLTDYEVKRADMLADLGYAVFALDLFGAGVRPTEDKDKRQHTGELYKDREKMRALMNGALDAAKNKGANIDNAAAFGYCFGGATVLQLSYANVNTPGMVPLQSGLAVRVTTEPPVNSCRPSADVLFRAMASCWGGGVLAVVLTGMGQDGLRGCEAIHLLDIGAQRLGLLLETGHAGKQRGNDGLAALLVELAYVET